MTTESPPVEHIGDSNPEKLVHDEADVLHVTQGRPYGEINFIGTYCAVGLGALAAYGGFVMPATSLLLINADIGKDCFSRVLIIPLTAL